MADASLATIWPKVYSELVEAGGIAERHNRDLTEFEFTVQNGRLFIGGARRAKRSPLAHIRVTLQLLVEGVLSPEELLARIKPNEVEALLVPEIVRGTRLRRLGNGLGVGGGAASGRIAFSTAAAERLLSNGSSPLLVVRNLSWEDEDTVNASAGVLDTVGGLRNHPALICGHLRKACVVRFTHGDLLGEPIRLIVAGCSPLVEGDCLTIDGMTGDVFAGRARVETKPWMSHPELVQLSMIVERAVASGHIPPSCAGAVWQIWDFFRHGILLRDIQGRNRVVQTRHKLHSLSPLKNANAIRQTMFYFEAAAEHASRDRSRPMGEALAEIPGAADAMRQLNARTWFEVGLIGQMLEENYGAALIGLVAAIERQFRLVLGSGRSHLHCRPLWEPTVEDYPDHSSQLVGFQFFDINQCIYHLIEISHIKFVIECQVPSPGEAWRLGLVGDCGVRIIKGSGTIKGCRIEVNGAALGHEDIPKFYTWLRRREYFWQWFEENATSHHEISAFLKRYERTGATDKRLAALCVELGLLRRGSLTTAGLSLIGGREKTLRRVP